MYVAAVPRRALLNLSRCSIEWIPKNRQEQKRSSVRGFTEDSSPFARKQFLGNFPSKSRLGNQKWRLLDGMPCSH